MNQLIISALCHMKSDASSTRVIGELVEHGERKTKKNIQGFRKACYNPGRCASITVLRC